MQLGSIILVIWPVTDAQIIAATYAGPAISLVFRNIGNLCKPPTHRKSRAQNRCYTKDEHDFREHFRDTQTAACVAANSFSNVSQR